MRLLEASESSFARRLKNDTKLKRIARQARNSTSYEVANNYAVRAGELLSESLQDNLGELAFISEDVAREVLTPMLTADHNLVAEVGKQIQTNMNKANGYGIEALIADLDTDRIEGLIMKVAGYDTTAEAMWALGEPVVNYSQAVVDQAIRKNFTMNSKLGIEAKLVRKTEAPGVSIRKIKRGNKVYTYSHPVPCQWCIKMAGTYDYADNMATGSDVYRRHEYCRCMVDYVQGGMRQDVWSKVSWTEDDSANRSALIRQKEEEKQREEARKAVARAERVSAVEQIQRRLGYSPKGASILYNTWKGNGSLDRLGFDVLLDMAENQQAAQRRS